MLTTILFIYFLNHGGHFQGFSGSFLRFPLNHFSRKSALLLGAAAAVPPLADAPKEVDPVVEFPAMGVVEAGWAWKAGRGGRPPLTAIGFLATCLGAIVIRVALTTGFSIFGTILSVVEPSEESRGAWTAAEVTPAEGGVGGAIAELDDDDAAFWPGSSTDFSP